MDDVTNENLGDLIDKAKSGDQDAIRSLQCFENDIRMMVRVRLPRPLRSQFDSMDFVQDVWQSFFRIFNHDPERFAQVRDLRGFLAGVARNKVYEEHRRRSLTQKYDLEREEPLYIRRGNRDIPREVIASDPSPSQDAQARERLDQLLEGRSPREAEVIELRRQGLTFEEIAAQTGLHERTVRRVIETIRRRMDARKDP
ncbi:RNA polymerase sigma factor [Singulisphaera acidiphila]|uniref:RNA polymerase sigma factor, sigma-70 family n=1 Tax=Singulisphaera acidiphila (strain ATCC BAA-1392 / DSM 18658 / VKM B-2454 / MOB10) TaxID=886293 RepID=L0DQC7_SINAD|nr:sigma-70 family RNA polymerase sigma factor [Singulisphaera acidiphila]AGA31075.1 RNA polymerase sigma factor, sigma-70 family [Singulisphaera acidiphila DSM 18658]